MSVLERNKHPTLLIKKTATKNNIIFNFVKCQGRLILFNTNLITETIFHMLKTSKGALNHHELCETLMVAAPPTLNFRGGGPKNFRPK